MTVYMTRYAGHGKRIRDKIGRSISLVTTKGLGSLSLDVIIFRKTLASTCSFPALECQCSME